MWSGDASDSHANSRLLDLFGTVLAAPGFVS